MPRPRAVLLLVVAATTVGGSTMPWALCALRPGDDTSLAVDATNWTLCATDGTVSFSLHPSHSLGQHHDKELVTRANTSQAYSAQAVVRGAGGGSCAVLAGGVALAFGSCPPTTPLCTPGVPGFVEEPDVTHEAWEVEESAGVLRVGWSGRVSLHADGVRTIVAVLHTRVCDAEGNSTAAFLTGLDNVLVFPAAKEQHMSPQLRTVLFVLTLVMGATFVLLSLLVFLKRKTDPFVQVHASARFLAFLPILSLLPLCTLPHFLDPSSHGCGYFLWVYPVSLHAVEASVLGKGYFAVLLHRNAEQAQRKDRQQQQQKTNLPKTVHWFFGVAVAVVVCVVCALVQAFGAPEVARHFVDDFQYDERCKSSTWWFDNLVGARSVVAMCLTAFGVYILFELRAVSFRDRHGQFKRWLIANIVFVNIISILPEIATSYHDTNIYHLSLFARTAVITCLVNGACVGRRCHEALFPSSEVFQVVAEKDKERPRTDVLSRRAGAGEDDEAYIVNGRVPEQIQQSLEATWNALDSVMMLIVECLPVPRVSMEEARDAVGALHSLLAPLRYVAKRKTFAAFGTPMVGRRPTTSVLSPNVSRNPASVSHSHSHSQSHSHSHSTGMRSLSKGSLGRKKNSRNLAQSILVNSFVDPSDADTNKEGSEL